VVGLLVGRDADVSDCAGLAHVTFVVTNKSEGKQWGSIPHGTRHKGSPV
jgi:hypothetical protein